MSAQAALPWNVLRIGFRAGSEPHQLKIIWEYRNFGEIGPYVHLGVSHADLETISDCASKARAALDALVDATWTKPGLLRPDLVKEIARAGADLRQALFSDDWSDGRACREASEFLEAAPGDTLVHFVVEGSVHAPWGLVYDGDPEMLPDEGESVAPDRFTGFWCLRHLVSCVYHRSEVLQDAMQRRVDEHRVLAVVHEGALEETLGLLPEAEQAGHRRFLERHGGALVTSGDLVAAWREARAFNRILLFFCHADGKNLHLSETDTIDTTYLKLRLAAREPASLTASFAILNGCHTAAAQAGSNGFIGAMTRPGLFGFIGTEAAIPKTYALRFGIELVETFLDTGMRVAEVMRLLQARHWPLSLVYGLYGDPMLRVRCDPSSTASPESAGRGNFSTGPFGEGSI